MSQTTCYKICRVVKGKYFSLYGRCFPKYDTEYRIGELVVPPIGKLFVFTSGESVKREFDLYGFVSNYDPCVILECVATDISYISTPTAFENVGNENHFSNFWTTGKIIDSKYFNIQNNIALAKSLIPIKVLTQEDILALR